MVRNLNGVLVRNENSGFDLFTHKSILNLSQELKDLWQKEVPVTIVIENDERLLFKASGDQLYYDKDQNNKYKLHIDGENLEDFLASKVGQLLYITLQVDGKEQADDGTEQKS